MENFQPFPSVSNLKLLYKFRNKYDISQVYVRLQKISKAFSEFNIAVLGLKKLICKFESRLN